MPSDPLILGFDTSAAHCAAALLCGGTIQAMHHADMARGQAENLMPMLEDLLSGAGIGWKDLTTLAVGIGPGNFTGIRISVSAARGLAFALNKPVFGISTFELMRDPSVSDAVSNELISVPGPRDKAYVQRFENARPTGQPQLIDPTAPQSAFAVPFPAHVQGFRATEIAAVIGAAACETDLKDIGARLVRRAAWRLAEDGAPANRPAPLYVKSADAAPSRDPAPVILDADT